MIISLTLQQAVRCIQWRNFHPFLRVCEIFFSEFGSVFYVLWHDGYSLGMDGTQIGVLKETNQISLAGLL